MNEQSQNRLRHYWLGWMAMLAFASVLSPINIHIVIAQETPELVVAPADPGEPPVPPEAPTVATEVAAEAQAAVTSATTAAPAVEPIASDVPATPSEISSDQDIGKLLPNEQPAVSVASEAIKTDPESVRTLSVEPGTRPMLPENRPAWVGAPADFTSAQHYLYVGSLPTLEPTEADAALDEPLVAAVRNYIDQEVVNEIGAANSIPVTAEFIRRNLIDNPEGFECELTTSQEPLFQKWVTVRITPEQRALFRKWHTEATQRSRLAPLGAGLVAVLSVISLSHVVLRRFSGASPLTLVNHHSPEAVVSANRRRSAASRLTFFGLLLTAILAAFLVPLFALTVVRVESRPLEPSVHSVDVHGLHKEIRIETLDGQRTIILENKSRR